MKTDEEVNVLILTFLTSERVGSCYLHTPAFLLLGNSPRDILDGRQSRSGRYGEETILLLHGFELRPLSRPETSQSL
jgi:hypothetical protein